MLPAGCLLVLAVGRGFVGVNVPVHDAQAVGKQQAADQRQLAQVIVGHDRDAPVPFLDAFGRHLHRVAIAQAGGQLSVKRDLGGAEGRGVGRGKPREMAADFRLRAESRSPVGWIRDLFLVHGHNSSLSWRLSAGRRPQVAQIDGADRRAVLLGVRHEACACGRAGEAQPPRQVAQVGGVGRQRVGLPVVQDLQVVLDGAQKGVAVRQHAIVVAREIAVLGQPRQGLQRVTGAELRLAAAVGQLQVLRHELGVADRAFAQLDFAPGAAGLAQVRLGQLLHLVHFGAHRVGPARALNSSGSARRRNPAPACSSPATTRARSSACFSHSRALRSR